MVSLFGKDLSFYTFLEGQAAATVSAAQELQKLAGDFGNAAKYAQRAEEIENEADTLGDQLLAKVDSTFVTPMDKEDLHAMSTALDDITDAIEAAIARVAMYRIAAPRPEFAGLCALVLETAQATNAAVGGLRHLHNRDTMQSALDSAHRVVNDSDKAFRTALASLFDAPDADPLTVMKWKEVYDRLEVAVDKCETIADVIGSIVIKYA